MTAGALKLYAKRPRRRSWGPEAALQYAIVSHMRLAPMPGAWCIHIPNQGKRTASECAHLMRMGMVTGAADLLVLVPKKPPLWLELKKRGERPTPEQISFFHLVEKSGHAWAWCDGINAALHILRAHGALKPDAGIRRRAA